MPLYTKQPSSKDGRIVSFTPTTNYGSEAFLLTQTSTGSNKQRSLLEFDISDLPAGVEITTAKLKLYYYFFLTADPVGRTIWAYKVTRTDWVEAQFTWNIYKTGSNWTTPGSDYVTSNPSGGSVVVPASTGVWMEWDIKAIVEDAIANEGDMVELLIRDAAETSQANFYDPFWRSKEAGQEAQRPKIEIEYPIIHEKEITEGIAAGEVLIKNPMKLVVEGVAMSEVLQKLITKAPFVEGIALGEVVESVRIKIGEFIEGLAIGEVLLKQTHKVVSEGIVIGEVITKAITRVYTEGLAVGEVVIKLTSRVITEGIAIGEVIFKMRVIQSIRSLTPLRVLDAIRNLLKERQL